VGNGLLQDIIKVTVKIIKRKTITRVAATTANRNDTIRETKQEKQRVTITNKQIQRVKKETNKTTGTTTIATNKTRRERREKKRNTTGTTQHIKRITGYEAYKTRHKNG
jgi:hypothetical protein